MQRHGHPSVNGRAAKIVDAIAANADALRLSVSTGSQGERLIDMGGATLGWLVFIAAMAGHTLSPRQGEACVTPWRSNQKKATKNPGWSDHPG